MSATSFTLDPERVLREFAIVSGASVAFLGNRGGFSGASIWRVQTVSQVFCLKAWPPSVTDIGLFDRMHAWMLAARQAGLDFIPHVYPRIGGATWIRAQDRCWDLTTWMPGEADFHARPTSERLCTAATALAQVHAAWRRPTSLALCPSVERRLQALAEWRRLAVIDWSFPAMTFPDPDWAGLLQRAGEQLSTWSPRLEAMLSGWRHKPILLQPCIGDIWHDHVFFQGEVVSGLIDFGAVRIDHPSTDLGRLLGSLIGDQDIGWTTALSAYRTVRPFSWEEESLAHLLDRTGVIVSLINWLRWCGRGERTFPDPAAVTQRLRSLVQRVEAWQNEPRIVGG